MAAFLSDLLHVSTLLISSLSLSLSLSLLRAQRRKEKARTHVISIPLNEPLLRFRIVEHLVEQQHALLDPVEFFRDLGFVVGRFFRSLYVSGH
jgi:hypothetical protein